MIAVLLLLILPLNSWAGPQLDQVPVAANQVLNEAQMQTSNLPCQEISCRKELQKAEPWIAKISDPKTGILSKISPESHLIIISDISHTTAELNQPVADILGWVKEKHPEFDCLYLEHSVEFQSQIDLFLAGKITWDQYSRLAAKSTLNALKPKTSNSDDDPAETAKEMLEFYKNKAAEAEKAKRLGMHIFGVDATMSQMRKEIYTPQDADSAIRSWGLERNQIMDQKIADLEGQKKCHMGLFIVGNGHTDGTPPGQKDKTVVGLARERGDQPLAINLWYHLWQTAGPLSWVKMSNPCKNEIVDELPKNPYVIDSHDQEFEGSHYDLWYFIPKSSP